MAQWLLALGHGLGRLPKVTGGGTGGVYFTKESVDAVFFEETQTILEATIGQSPRRKLTTMISLLMARYAMSFVSWTETDDVDSANEF